MIYKLATIFLLAAALACAQAQHSAVLTWTDAQNPSGTTYTVYRAQGLCSGTPAFSKVATGVAALTYEDTTVQPGNYCYSVSATVAGVESPQSNTAQAPVPAFAPQTLNVTVK